MPEINLVQEELNELQRLRKKRDEMAAAEDWDKVKRYNTLIFSLQGGIAKTAEKRKPQGYQPDLMSRAADWWTKPSETKPGKAPAQPPEPPSSPEFQIEEPAWFKGRDETQIRLMCEANSDREGCDRLEGLFAARKKAKKPELADVIRQSAPR